MARLNYPRALLEVLILVEDTDRDTIAAVLHEMDELWLQDVDHFRLLTFAGSRPSKPKSLNIGLRHATGDVVAVFDAEDELGPDVLNIANTVMRGEGVSVVQCGVTLVNYRDHWFSALNALEYFFWFKSRMTYHTRLGLMPLAGNSFFIERRLLQQLGGWREFLPHRGRRTWSSPERCRCDLQNYLPWESQYA